MITMLDKRYLNFNTLHSATSHELISKVIHIAPRGVTRLSALNHLSLCFPDHLLNIKPCCN